MTATGLACLILTMALLISGRIIFQFFPAVDGERLFASVSMPIGTSVEETQKVAQQLVKSGRLLEQELKEQGSDIRITDTMVSAGIRSSVAQASEMLTPVVATKPKLHFRLIYLQITKG